MYINYIMLRYTLTLSLRKLFRSFPYTHAKLVALKSERVYQTCCCRSCTEELYNKWKTEIPLPPWNNLHLVVRLLCCHTWQSTAAEQYERDKVAGNQLLGAISSALCVL